MRRNLFGAAALCAAAWAVPAAAQLTDNTVKIGVATDMSSLYSDINGPGAVIAVQMAIEDFGGSVLGQKVEMVSSDIQNKADVAATTAGRWFDTEKVDVILGTGASSSSIATSRVANDKKKIYLATDPASSDLTGKLCNAYTVHWTYDTSALANGTGSAVVKAGGKTWFFLTADYAFGYALERDVSAVVTKAGGKVLGSVKHPINSNDFSSFLLQAQASKAQIIGLANAGGDTINSIKQASEFGIVKGGQKLAGLLVFVSDIHSLGLERAQGLSLTEAFYWDLNDKTRAFSKRFAARHGGKMPTMVQAGFYSAALQYLNAVKAAGTDNSDKVMATLKSTKWDDPVFGPSYIRPDGRKMHSMYLFEVKKPSESKGPWDYYKLIATIPGEEAFRPMDQGDCPLVKKN
ncbi:ABC transporter substrate-binding protein [Reyranella sp.]|uniref:ABC transporter substrate-binding protein n=1 Tax=Reyranella sp. TaxID=1929291 RepID=UPI002730275A|nr:ABC transporter substrate-binding protein [Reyranella sp.]MDP2372803.1 ABC transporter substrate-binding protein [Reyranella sp.]